MAAEVLVRPHICRYHPVDKEVGVLKSSCFHLGHERLQDWPYLPGSMEKVT